MEKIKQRLIELTNNSTSPYYHHEFASIIECKDGKLFEGVNVETSSPAAGICAERNALFSAITAGYKKNSFKRIYLMDKMQNEVYPCFICRQAIYEYCNSQTEIIIFTQKGIIKTNVGKLCVFK